MIATTFDILKYAKQLREAEFSEKQTYDQTRDVGLRKDMQQMEEKLVSKLKTRLGFMLTAAITIIAAIFKL